jgi:hypothetical protein
MTISKLFNAAISVWIVSIILLSLAAVTKFLIHVVFQ